MALDKTTAKDHSFWQHGRTRFEVKLSYNYTRPAQAMDSHGVSMRPVRISNLPEERPSCKSKGIIPPSGYHINLHVQDQGAPTTCSCQEMDPVSSIHCLVRKRDHSQDSHRVPGGPVRAGPQLGVERGIRGLLGALALLEDDTNI